MEQLDRVRTFAKNEFFDEFAPEGQKEPETILSFQTDTWARVRRIIEHDQETDEEYSIRVQEMTCLESSRGPAEPMIEGGYQYEWDDGEVSVDRPFSRFGIFRVTLESDDKNLGGFVFVRTPYSVTDGMVTLNVSVGLEKDLKAWVEAQAMRERTESTLSEGIYRGVMGDGGLVLQDLEDVLEMDPIHPKRETLTGEIDRFFDNAEVFTRMGQKGTKKWLLVGPPGTGKTTLMQYLARKHEEKRPCVFVSDVKAMAAVQKKAAENDQSAIIFVEDAEETFKTNPMGGGPGQRGGASSSVLQLLDGVNQPANQSGCAVIMSTNHPEQIEDRILSRPGRIDHIVDVGLLEAEYAARCADLYLPTDHEVTIEVLADIFDGFSGDEIRAICSSAVALAVSEQEEEISESLIGRVIDRMEEQLNAAEEYAHQQSELQDTGGDFFQTSPNGQ